MRQQCDVCGQSYDDEHRLTLCPHPRLSEPVPDEYKLALVVHRYVQASLDHFHATKVEALGDSASTLRARQARFEDLVGEARRLQQ